MHSTLVFGKTFLLNLPTISISSITLRVLWVVIYTRDAQTFHAPLTDMAENALDAPSLNLHVVFYLSTVIQGPGHNFHRARPNPEGPLRTLEHVRAGI